MNPNWELGSWILVSRAICGLVTRQFPRFSRAFTEPIRVELRIGLHWDRGVVVGGLGAAKTNYVIKGKGNETGSLILTARPIGQQTRPKLARRENWKRNREDAESEFQGRLGQIVLFTRLWNPQAILRLSVHRHIPNAPPSSPLSSD